MSEELEPKMTPFRQLSDLVRKGVVGSLRRYWDDKSFEDQVHYLKGGGLDDCYGAGVTVTDEMLRAAGISPEEAEAVRREVEDFLSSHVPETRAERMKRFAESEREFWAKMSREEQIEHLKIFGLNQVVAIDLKLPESVLGAAGYTQADFERAEEAHRKHWEERERDGLTES